MGRRLITLAIGDLSKPESGKQVFSNRLGVVILRTDVHRGIYQAEAYRNIFEVFGSATSDHQSNSERINWHGARHGRKPQ